MACSATWKRLAMDVTRANPPLLPLLLGLTVMDTESLSKGYVIPESWPVPALEREGMVMVIEQGLLPLRSAAFRLQRSAIAVEPGAKMSPTGMQLRVPRS